MAQTVGPFKVSVLNSPHSQELFCFGFSPAITNFGRNFQAIICRLNGHASLIDLNSSYKQADQGNYHLVAPLQPFENLNSLPRQFKALAGAFTASHAV